MKFLIVGDLSLQDRAVRKRWDEKTLALAFVEVQRIAKTCDHAILNLESPLTEAEKPIVKDGPTLKNATSVLDVIRYCGFDTITLANNHLKDYGKQGVMDTIERCKENCLQVVGAGANIRDARRAVVYNGEDLKVGILNVCEHESSIATEKTAGAAPLDLVNLFYDIQKLRKEVDRVIVIIHGGCEHYQLPTPRMKREYRLIMDYGADVIVNHHQHCYSGYELYKGKPIFYGIGNFFFDNPKKRHDKWNEGLLLELELSKEQTDFKLLPYRQCDKEPVIEMREYDDVKENIEHLNTIISDDKQLKENFDRLVSSKYPLYPFLPYGNHYLRGLYNRGYLPDGMSNLRKVKMENVISCESHREVLLCYFENVLKHE